MRLLRIISILLLSLQVAAQNFTAEEMELWKEQASRIEIIRDTWGIPHVFGKTDADAVFGMLYAQCEDDFSRVEANYINMLGRSAEVYGKQRIWHDVRMKLFYDTTVIKQLFASAPTGIKQLMQAFADGINYFLATHPHVKPLLLNRFEPWWPLLFSEGSIGGDIESISLRGLREFYSDKPFDIGFVEEKLEPEQIGSNGFAIAPEKSASNNALLLINPHTSFYFRSELQMQSKQGLNAYGAVTWGQFFIYQGFNSRSGWMHTSTGADVIDEYLETVIRKNEKLFYQHGEALKPVKQRNVAIKYLENNTMQSENFDLYFTHHGPIVARENDRWLAVSLMVNPVDALMQSYYRTKSKSLKDFKKYLEWKTNSSNNTVFADKKGNIAYFHGNFMPRRNPSIDWSKPVDGSDPLTDWMGLHEVEEIVQCINPSTGWIQNCNSTPFTVAGEASPLKHHYPFYMAPDAENPRGINAVRLLENEKNFTLDKLIAKAYDSYLVGFERLIPALVQAYDEWGSKQDSLNIVMQEPIELLRGWDMRSGKASIPTTLATFFGQTMREEYATQMRGMDRLSRIHYMTVNTTSEEKVKAFKRTLEKLDNDFGSWRQPWGEVNRFQRLTGKINETFDDAQFSLPVGFASSYWGSLASFGARTFNGTKKLYGYSGNSFVAVVEFGKKVRAKAIVTGGQAANPESPHFMDQAELYANGQFRDVYYYKEDIIAHQERHYRLAEK